MEAKFHKYKSYIYIYIYIGPPPPPPSMQTIHVLLLWMCEVQNSYLKGMRIFD